MFVFFINAQETTNTPQVGKAIEKPVLFTNVAFGTIIHSSDEIHYQFSYESQSDYTTVKDFDKKDCNRNESSILKLSYISKNVNINSQTVIGNGFEVSFGPKFYSRKNPNMLTRFYTELDILNYSRIYFCDKNYSGVYEFFKIPIIPNFGYKFVLAKALSVDISAGMRYKIEIKGRDDVDNNQFDEIDFNAGFRLGYQF